MAARRRGAGLTTLPRAQLTGLGFDTGTRATGAPVDDRATPAGGAGRNSGGVKRGSGAVRMGRGMGHSGDSW